MKNFKLKLALIVVVSFFPVWLLAKQVNPETARQVAETQVRSRSQLRSDRLPVFELVHTETTAGTLRASGSASTNVLYYVYNVEGNGFVIVSGDDIAVPVLGYSEQGSYDNSNPNFSYWMDCLAKEITWGIENNIPQSAEIKAKWETYLNDNTTTLRASNGVVVNPLVLTKWNQDAPYNTQCPKYNNTAPQAVTGCVATAMAQIMKYWNYPATGVGSNTYTPPRYGFQQITVDFSSIPYDWGNMSYTYSSSNTPQENNAVAILMYHCGVSVNMDYGFAALVNPNDGGSSASAGAVVSAFVKYFQYDAGINYLERDYYSYTEWLNFIKPELDANRPVFYSGQGSGGGHAFVCDGYDSDDLFHFNWGWSGSSDGYFELSALNPNSLGIGGGAGGFNFSQSIIVGIRPDAGGSALGFRMGLSNIYSSSTSLSIGTAFDVTIENLTNISSFIPSSGTIGVQLCNDDGSPIAYTPYILMPAIPPGNFWKSYLFFPSPNGYQLPQLPSGIYRLYGAFSLTTNPYTPIKIEGVNGDKYIRIEITGTTVTLTPESDIASVPSLSLESLAPVGDLYPNKTGRFMASITNNGTGDYNSQMTIQLGSQTIATDPVVIPAGTTTEVGFSGTISLSPETYPLTLWYDPNNNLSTPSVQLPPSASAVVQAAPPDPVLSVTSVSFPNANAVSAIEPNLSVKIKNDGGMFEGNIIVFIFNLGGGTSVGYFGPNSIIIEGGEEITILFNNSLNFSAGNYFCMVYTTDGTNSTPISPFIQTGFTLTATWVPQLSSTNWNNPNNWIPYGIPDATTTVIIPKSSSSPILTAQTTISEIHFAPGAELGRQDLLTYQKAYVQLDFSSTGLARNRWWMLTNPLQQLFVGDLSFGGLPGMDIKEYGTDQTSENKDQGVWKSFTGYDNEFAAGDNFQIWFTDDPAGATKGLAMANDIITLPYFEDPAQADVHWTHKYNAGKSMFYEWTPEYAIGNLSATVTRDLTKAYKLTAVATDGTFTKNLDFGLGVNNKIWFAATGNPFMSSISFEKLQGDNSGLIGETYWVWVGAGLESGGSYVTYNAATHESVGSTNVTLSDTLPPMQSFIVEGNAAGIIDPQITFNIANINATGQNGDVGLRSAVQSNDLLEIIASTPQSAVRTVIASLENGSQIFNHNDSRRFSAGINLLPDLYMLKPDADNSMVAVTANILNEIKEDVVIPLAISTTYEGPVTLSFAGMDTYNARIFFVDNDAQSKKETELTGQSRYEYTFNYVPEKVNGTVTANESRFSIRLAPANETGIDFVAPNDILIYSRSANTIQVISGELIQQLSVFNLQGQKIYDNASLNAYEHTVNGLVPGIYIVKAVSKNEQRTMKIIVK